MTAAALRAVRSASATPPLSTASTSKCGPAKCRPARPERRGQDDRRLDPARGSAARTPARSSCSVATLAYPPHGPRSGLRRKRVGFPPTLRVREIVDLVRAHFPAPAPAGELLDRFGLAGIARRQTGGLSGGERRRLSVALAFAGRPRAIFLDEPTAGLDVEIRRAVWQEIRAYSASGGTVLLTTHHVEEAEALASRIVLLAGGRVVAEGLAGRTVRARRGHRGSRMRSSR